MSVLCACMCLRSVFCVSCIVVRLVVIVCSPSFACVHAWLRLYACVCACLCAFVYLSVCVVRCVYVRVRVCFPFLLDIYVCVCVRLCVVSIARFIFFVCHFCVCACLCLFVGICVSV